MRLSFTTENGDFRSVEVNPSLSFRDLKSLIEAESMIPSSSQQLFHNGNRITDDSKTLQALNIQNDDILLVKQTVQASSSSHSSNAGHTSGRTELLRQQIINDPRLISQLTNSNPRLVDAAFNNPDAFKQMVEEVETMRRKQREEAELANADPFDIEAQKKIEERIRQEQITQNFETALEYNPEAFGRVVMLYINAEVNGRKVKAFVDSGAQATIMSPSLAKECSLTHLIDSRFAGIAHGVGTAKILGRIHAAQMKVGDLFLICSFTVMDGKGVDLLFGLDMLKRHQACIDLKKHVLTIQNVDIPFLSEHELPEKAKLFDMGSENLEESPSTSVSGTTSSVQPTHASSSVISPNPASTNQPITQTPIVVSSNQTRTKEGDVEQLMALGFTRDESIQALQSAGGNVDLAANLLFQ